MINKESGILKLFGKESWRKFTFTEIRTLTNKKSKSYLSKVLDNFVKQGILLKERIGRSLIYFINLQNPKARLFASFVLEDEGWSKKNIPYKKIIELMNKIPTKDYILFVAGSYAENKQKPTSDLDIVIVIDDSMELRKVYAELNSFCELSIPQIHLYVFRNNEFLEMLTNKEHNYGKEIANKNLLLYGGEIYMQIVKEAIDNGFTNKDFY